VVFHAVLVTGAPAAGKSALLSELRKRTVPIHAVEFGQLIASRLKAQGRDLSHSELRERSAQVVSPHVVASLDAAVADDISSWLQQSHVVIASHAVTHEDYGVRITAFSHETLSRLPLSAIVVLQAPPEVLVERVKTKEDGRTWNTPRQAQRLQDLQSTLALTYGVACGCPVYIFDSTLPTPELADAVLAALQANGFLMP